MNYFIAVVIVFLGFSQASNASEPGDGSDKKGAKGSEVILKNDKSQEIDNIDSVIKSVNDMETDKTPDNTVSTGKLSLSCDVTPSIENLYITKEPFEKSNNLIRKPGSALKAKGQYVSIKGQVMDEDCLPISDAVIQIWQTDSAGGYLESYKTNSEWDVASANYDKNFAYSGSAQTNNLGEYNFVTILPYSKIDEVAPSINFVIKHPDFKEITTIMYFKNHPKNDSDVYLAKVPEERKSLLFPASKPIDPSGQVEGREYNFNITLEGINKFRRY
jgi:protocatechuate 3,4-dioxygenase beta subunit